MLFMIIFFPLNFISTFSHKTKINNFFLMLPHSQFPSILVFPIAIFSFSICSLLYKIISKNKALVGKTIERGKNLVKTGSSFSVLASYSELKII